MSQDKGPHNVYVLNFSEIDHQLSDSEDSSDIGSGTDSSDSSSGSESESSSEGENVPMTRMNSRKIKLRKEMADSKASEVFTKMLEKNNKNINNTNKQTLGSTLGSSTAGNLPFRKMGLKERLKSLLTTSCDNH